MLEQIRYDKLFATPLLRFRVPEHEALNAALLDQGKRMRAEDGGAARSNRGGWHSRGNLFEHDIPSVTELRDLATEAIFAANDRIGAQAARDSLALRLFAWMNANPLGGFNAPHSHPGAHWSGVYYVAQPDMETGNSGMIEFIDPRTDLPNWRILQAPSFRMKKTLRPAAGEMILFPSYLVHWVYPNEAEAERWTIAFNATFAKARR